MARNDPGPEAEYRPGISKDRRAAIRVALPAASGRPAGGDPSSRGGRGRVIFLNRFYYPDHSATAQILTDVASGLASEGHDVTVVTSRTSYDNRALRLPARQAAAGVSIIRVRSTGFGRERLPGRIADYLTFYIASVFSLLARARRGDVVVIKTDPPLLAVPAGFAAKLRGAVTVNWLQDIFPETASALGVRFATGPAGSLARRLRDRSLRRADCNVVIGPRMAERIAASGADPARTVEIQNFCDDEAIRPVPARDNALRAAWGFSPDDFVIGYSGNLGRAHDITTILGAAEALAGDEQIRFLFVGGGHLARTLEAEALARGLSSIITKPYQPREQLRLSLSVPDVHWASLHPELEGLIVPSKIYGVAAAGRPLLMIGDPAGDAGRLVTQHRFGSAIPIGAVEALAGRIASWKQNPDLVGEMGRNARAFTDSVAARRIALERWSGLMAALTRTAQQQAPSIVSPPAAQDPAPASPDEAAGRVSR